MFLSFCLISISGICSLDIGDDTVYYSVYHKLSPLLLKRIGLFRDGSASWPRWSMGASTLWSSGKSTSLIGTVNISKSFISETCSLGMWVCWRDEKIIQHCYPLWLWGSKEARGIHIPWIFLIEWGASWSYAMLRTEFPNHPIDWEIRRYFPLHFGTMIITSTGCKKGSSWASWNLQSQAASQLRESPSECPWTGRQVQHWAQGVRWSPWRWQLDQALGSGPSGNRPLSMRCRTCAPQATSRSSTTWSLQASCPAMCSADKYPLVN